MPLQFQAFNSGTFFVLTVPSPALVAHGSRSNPEPDALVVLHVPPRLFSNASYDKLSYCPIVTCVKKINGITCGHTDTDNSIND